MSKFGLICRTALQRSLVYRLTLYSSLFSLAVPVLINCVFWSAVYSGGGTHYGYTFPQMMVYTVVSSLIYFVIGSDIAEEISGDVYAGTLSQYLVKPISYMGYRFSAHIGGIAVQGAAFLALGAAFFAVMSALGLYSVTPTQILLFAPSAVLAAVLNFLLMYCLAMAAFWFTRVWYMYWTMRELARLLGGAVMPLSVMGGGFLAVSRFLPFQYTVYFPARLLLEGMGVSQALGGIAAQALWIVLLYLLSRLLWSRGLRKYIAVGG